MENIKKFVKKYGIDNVDCIVYPMPCEIMDGENTVVGFHLDIDDDELALFESPKTNGYNFFNTDEENIKSAFEMVKIEEIDTLLHDGIVSFTYKKKDGTIRNARGTLLPEYCPKSKGGGHPVPNGYQLYYDLDCESFKCFNKSRLIKVKE